MNENQNPPMPGIPETAIPFILEDAISDPHDRALLTALVNSAILGSVIVTYLEQDFPFLFANAAYLELLGFSSTEEYRQSIHDLANNSIHPDDRLSPTEEEIRRCVALGRYDRDHRLQRKDGSFLWVEDRARVFTARNGRHVIVCTCLDITPLMEAKRALERERTMLDYALNGISGGIGLYRIRDHRAEMVYASDRLWELSGYSKEVYADIASRDAGALIYEKDYPHLVQTVLAWLKAPEQPLNATVRLCGQGQSLIWVQMHISCLDRSGDAPLIHIVFRNVSLDEAAYDELLDFPDLSVQVVDLETLEILFANHKSIQIFGVVPDARSGSPRSRWSAPASTDPLAALRRQGSCEYELTGGSGQVYRVQLQRTHWRGWDAFVELTSDITAEKQVQQLQEQEQFRLRASYEEQVANLELLSRSYMMTMKLDLTDELVLELTDHHAPVRLNPECRTIDALKQKIFRRFSSASARDDFFQVMDFSYLRAQYAKGQQHLVRQQEHCLPDGTVLWAEYVFNLRENPDTQHLTAFVSARDITQETLSAAALQKIAADGYLTIAVINSVTGRYIRYSRKTMAAPDEGDYSDILFRSVARFVPEDKRPAVLRALSLDTVLQALTDQPVYKTVVESQRDNDPAHRIYEFSHINPARTLLLMTASDITEAVQLERRQQQALADALAQAKEANAAKDTFFSNMSHDIRTPLNAILNLTALMRQELDDSFALTADLDKIEMSSNYLLGLINEVLDLSRIESGRMELHPEVYTYQEFLSYLTSVIQPMCVQKNITFHLVPGPTALDIYLDKVRFNQIFINLMSNAVKYTDLGGEVSFSVTNAVIQDGVLTSDFIIRDNGRGMSEEFQERLFRPFEREDTSNAYSGTGLGLSITKNVVDAMGGAIRVDSKLGVGTTVTVRLPMPLATPEQIQLHHSADPILPPEKAAGGDGCSGARILVVEDHILNQEIVQRILVQYGALVECVSDGQAAVDRFLASDPGYFDAILMDIRMPTMNGYDATRAIRRAQRTDAARIPIIAMTAEAFSSDVQAARDAGMNDHLAKPIIPARLHATLCRWLQRWP